MAKNTTKRKWDLIPKDRRAQISESIITYFRNEHELELGVIASEEILDFVQEELYDTIYNQAISDAKKVLQDRIASLEIDLDLLASQ